MQDGIPVTETIKHLFPPSFSFNMATCRKLFYLVCSMVNNDKRMRHIISEIVNEFCFIKLNNIKNVVCTLLMRFLLI